MTAEEKREIIELVLENLDAAEARWRRVGRLLKEAASADEFARKGVLVPTKFPGVPIVDSEVPVVQRFVALMADMRGSTSHLLEPLGMASGIQRLYYETSALLPALTKIVTNHNGTVTEYAGDGILGFRAVSDNPSGGDLLEMVNAGEDCIATTRAIVNPILRERYNLPPLSIGVGIALGPVLLSVIGVHGDLRPLGFGESVFRASKLSKGENIVVVHESMKKAWPNGKGGKVSFKSISIPRDNALGYIVTRG
jgi:class 3 adenylate cyclase